MMNYNISTRYENCKKIGYNWKKCSSIKCAKYEEKGHIVANCVSEKIN